MTNRRTFLALCAGAGLTGTLSEAVWSQLEAAEAVGPVVPLDGQPARSLAIPISREAIRGAEVLAGVTFTDAERDQMRVVLESYLNSYRAIRAIPLTNRTPPAYRFSPILAGRSYRGSTRPAGVWPSSRPQVSRPSRSGELAYMTIAQLGELVRTRQVTSLELTKLAFDRLRRFDPTLRCVMTYLDERALRQAEQADREIAAGRYRGPLHGIPYGVKDSVSIAGYPTTWGVAAYRNRVIATTATVVQKLDAAGAIAVAKLSMGELGLNDRWFGGQTVNPWRLGQGSLGSSSGSAAATSAGLVPFAIGQETLGSIIVPAARTGVTALRPTFGRVSRTGTMTLCWTLDKIGPMARSAEDCAIVLEAIHGPGSAAVDPTVEPIPFQWNPEHDLSRIRVGYDKAAFDSPRQDADSEVAVLQQLAAMGVRLVPVDLPHDLPVNAMLFVRVEAVAALDEISRAGGLGILAEQHEAAWPNFIRSGRLVSAFEYIQANRLRTVLMERLDACFRNVDVIVAPTQPVVSMTNLAGLPSLVAPAGFNADRTPTSITFIGRPFGEGEICTVARAWQEATIWSRLHPEMFST